MPKIVNHTQMRNHILKQSHMIFGKKGYQSVSMRILAKEIGVTTGVLYHYFEDKESLVQAVLSMGLQDSILGKNSDKTFFNASGSSSITQKIEHLFKGMNDKDDIAITNIMLLSDYYRDLKTNKKIKQNYNVAFQFLDSFRKSMDLDIEDMDLARFLLTYLVGMHTIRMWTAKKMSINEFGKTLLKYFTNPEMK
jgi:AcrR family transcriptional regulator